jgi:hypothetical protein
LKTKMFLQRSAIAIARRAAVAPALRRSIATSAVRRKFVLQAFPEEPEPSEAPKSRAPGCRPASFYATN